MRAPVLGLALALAACSLKQPPNPGRPEVEIHRQSALFFGSGGEAPLNLLVSISNPGKEPIIVRRIRVTASSSMTQYSIRPAERYVRETIAPGETKELYLTATAFTNRVRLDPTEPLGLRATVDFESGGKRLQELYVLLIVGQ